MIPIDRPNTLFVTPGYARSRLFFPFRYKQDDLGDDCGMLCRNDFTGDKTTTFEFEHSIFTMPYMR